jgi:hypothetical protein
MESSACVAILSRSGTVLRFGSTEVREAEPPSRRPPCPPVVLQPNQLSFRKWYGMYKYFLKDMFATLLAAIDSNEFRSHLHVEAADLYRAFAMWAYARSSNASKSFPWDCAAVTLARE